MKFNIENKTKFIKRNSMCFTLVELIVAMATFSLIMVLMIGFFSSAQKIWVTSSQRSMIYENARLAMDMITKDLQSAQYEKDKIPFWNYAPADYHATPAGWLDHRYGGIAFITSTTIPPNSDCTSLSYEVKYQLAYGSTYRGWLRRSVTGNKLSGGADDTKWGYSGKFCVALSTTQTEAASDLGNGADDDSDGYIDDDGTGLVFTANSNSSQSWQKVIPYVTKLKFTCYDEDRKVIPYNIISDSNTGPDGGLDTEFPAMVRVELSLLDKQTWTKWIAMGGDINAFKEDFDNESLDPSVQSEAYKLRKSYERTFTKMIFME